MQNILNTNPDILNRLIIGVRCDPEQPRPRIRGGIVRKPTRQRKPSLTSVIRQAAKAGVEIAGYEVRPDGTIGVIVGKPVGDVEIDGTSSDPKWN